MNELMIDTTGSQWVEIYDICSIHSEEVKGKIKLYIREMTGTKFDISTKTEGERSDVTVFIPIIYIKVSDFTDAYRILKEEGQKYKPERVPSCFLLSKNMRMTIDKDNITIRYQETTDPILSIDINKYTYEVIKNLKNMTIFMIDKESGFVSSIPIGDNEEDYSIFPIVQNMSVFGKELDLKKLVPKISHFEQEIAFKPDYMQDVQQGASDYYCYESTSEKESLPSNKSLTFKRCFACGKDEKSREHCSPKWIADRYKVKPLVADTFCKECNNWFGVNLENKMQQFLTTGCIGNKELIHWCIKTSLTMSIASGVPLNTNDLIQLRKDITPLDYEVYFDTFGCQNRGFYYGVSHFETQIRERGTFLFTFTMPEFSFVVIKNKEGISLDVPIKKIWPQVANQSTSTPHVLNFTDLHKNLHEILSRQKTEDVDLKFRTQNR